MNQNRLKELAKDLRKEPPKSPRDMLGGYVILARCLDKCRSFLLGINGIIYTPIVVINGFFSGEFLERNAD